MYRWQWTVPSTLHPLPSLDLARCAVTPSATRVSLERVAQHPSFCVSTVKIKQFQHHVRRSGKKRWGMSFDSSFFLTSSAREAPLPRDRHPSHFRSRNVSSAVKWPQNPSSFPLVISNLGLSLRRVSCGNMYSARSSSLNAVRKWESGGRVQHTCV